MSDERVEPPVATGDSLCGRFAITRRIAGGGTAVTFEARDTVMDEVVAVKVAREPMDIDRTMFLDQFMKIARLRSPYFPASFGYFEHRCDGGSYPVISLEHIEGPALGDYLGSATETKCLEVTRQLALALDAVDASGMRHGDIDIHGGNVLVRDDVPVLIDPGSIGRTGSHGTRNDDFEDFIALIAKAKIGLAFPTILALLKKVDRTTRPFRAAEAILRHKRSDVILTAPAERLRALRNTYQRQAADVQGAYGTLVRVRRIAFADLAREAEEACLAIGLKIEPTDHAREAKDAEPEISCIDTGTGDLRASYRRFRAASGRRWDLILQSRSGFALPSPYAPASVCAEIASYVTSHDGPAFLHETIRVRLASEDKYTLEVQAGAVWAPAPEDMMLRAVEALVGERIVAFPSNFLIPGEKTDPDTLGADFKLEDGDLVDGARGDFATVHGTDSLRQSMEMDLQHGHGEWAVDPTAGTRLTALREAERAAWNQLVTSAFENEFVPKWGMHFCSAQRYDVVHVDGHWHLEVVAVLANPSLQRVQWRFPLQWLDESSR